MTNYLAIYNGAADENAKAHIGDEQRTAFLDARSRWARDHEQLIVDNRSPLFRKKRLTSAGSDDFTDSKTGYAIVRAASHEDAVQVFVDHPHLTLNDGNWIEVLECPTMPG